MVSGAAGGTGNMSADESWEEIDPKCDAQSFVSPHLLSIKVEYYRSFEYSLKWKTPMSPRRSSKKSTKKTPESGKDAAKLRLRSQRGRSRLKETDANEGEDFDIINIINEDPDTDPVAKGGAVGLLSYGLDESDDEAGSIVSGPSMLCYDNREELHHSLCSACQKLYKKAKGLKTPIKSKLLDNDPESLTCDQWVLIKKWKPRRLPDARRKLLSQVQVGHGITLWQGEQSSPCSRPHVFLQRNLRRVSSSAEVKRNTRRKRRRGNSQGSRVAKQKRLQSNQHANKTNNHNTNSRLSSCSKLSDGPGIVGRAEKHVTVGLVPPSAKVPPPKKTCEFRDLLAQLRGNSSMIIRETTRPRSPPASDQKTSD